MWHHTHQPKYFGQDILWGLSTEYRTPNAFLFQNLQKCSTRKKLGHSHTCKTTIKHLITYLAHRSFKKYFLAWNDDRHFSMVRFHSIRTFPFFSIVNAFVMFAVKLRGNWRSRCLTCTPRIYFKLSQHYLSINRRQCRYWQDGTTWFMNTHLKSLFVLNYKRCLYPLANLALWHSSCGAPNWITWGPRSSSTSSPRLLLQPSWSASLWPSQAADMSTRL